MAMKYLRGEMTLLSPHFFSLDFDCKCQYPECQFTYIDPNLIPALENLHKLSGPFHIDSGFRCINHNKDVGGKEHSQHIVGRAADCRSLNGHAGKEMASFALLVPDFAAGGIGIYDRFVHCDIRPQVARWDLSHSAQS